MRTARAQAIANENASIDASQSRALAARQAEDSRPRNALEAMAHRLQVSPAGLKDTLLKTVFSGCRNDSEFIALTVVSNAYGLNPLTKEIYAFPAKGGGIVPMVSVDGWIRIMNEHPQFDGIEFDHIVDQKGKIDAIEAIIYRKDRSHPIKVIEYLEECKRGSEPWKLMPNRMLRNRALIQGARIAFGFSGIVAEGDEIEVEARTVQALPSRQSLAEELNDEIPTFDGETGEIVDDGPRDSPGLTEVDEETARKLDAGQVESDPDSEIEGTTEDRPDDTDPGEPAEEQPDTLDPKAALLDKLRADLAAATALVEVNAANHEWLKHRVVYDDATVAEIDGLITEAFRRVRGEGK